MSAIRHKLGMTQRRFADSFGFSHASVRAWEQGLRAPSGPTRALMRIIDADPGGALRALGVEWKPKRKRR